MKKVVSLNAVQNAHAKSGQLPSNVELLDRVRSDAIADLESLGNDFQHMVLVVESIHRNYKALLGENQQLKSAILQSVEQCSCHSENRCDRCQQLLQPITGKNYKLPAKPAHEYQVILKQLRRRSSV